jgi:(1->4)-alpha-D-glucan 1-alpha-D-glucosylmutase
VLSELPDRWEAEVTAWSKLNQKYKTPLGERQIPDANDEYFLYQTLVGAFPFEPEAVPQFGERVKEYVIKAVREAKVHTAWLQPDRAYEEGFINFVEQILKPTARNKFLIQFQAFWNTVADYGIYNSLSQTLLKITAPGVPDFYQGTELWDFSLVDPDNRRPVDYAGRIDSLKAIQQGIKVNILGLCEQLLENRRDGRLKQFLILQALAIRHRYHDVFAQGSYVPIPVMGPYEKHVIAFARQLEQQMVLTVVPRFLADLIQPGEYPLAETVWADTVIEIPQGLETTWHWQEGITGQSLPGGHVLAVGQTLKYFPVALLVGEASKGGGMRGRG